MPISNAANINSSGVLLSSSSLSQLILSENGSSIEVGAGNVWSQVYEYLAPFELTVVGGRAGMYIPQIFFTLKSNTWSKA